MKSRFLILTMGLLMVLAIGADAYAQAVFTVSGSNRPRGRMNGHGELAGGITLAKLSGSSVGAEVGAVIIDYGVPITNAVDTDTDATTSGRAKRHCSDDLWHRRNQRHCGSVGQHDYDHCSS